MLMNSQLKIYPISEIEADRFWEVLAQKRDIEEAEFISHEKAWN
ncbi:hypothetical protein ACFLZY_02465 [Patescibacteria group bacterium]